MDLDLNTVPDNIVKARAIVQLARAAVMSRTTLEDDTVDLALWAVEDFLAEARDANAAREVAAAVVALGKEMGRSPADS